MNDTGATRPIQAGKAFMAAIADDPTSQRSLLRLRAFAESIKAVGATYGEAIEAVNQVFALPNDVVDFTAEMRRQREEAFADLADEIAKSMRTAKAELALYDLTLPADDLDSWEDLARLAEKEPGPMTVRDIHDWAIAWARRELLRHKIARGELPIQAADKFGSCSETRSPEDASIRWDEHDPRIAWCMGKRIYLGEDTQISRLFWLLASPVGRACTLAEVQRAIDGFETDRERDSDRDGFKQASQRVRKAISRLRRAICENGADHHVTIVRGGSNEYPEYTMLVRFPK